MLSCQVCKKSCKPRCCTQCRKAFYCSIKCQKNDWKAGHRERCHPQRPLQETAEMALQQLVTITSNIFPEQAKEHWAKASDEVLRQQNDLGKRMKQALNIHSSIMATQKENGQTASAFENLSFERASQVMAMEQCFDFVVEDMIHISRFQFLLRCRPHVTEIDMTTLQLSTKKMNNFNSSLVELFASETGLMFSVLFPRSLENANIHFLNETTLQLSLPYLEDPTVGQLGVLKQLTPIETINKIQCSSCRQSLLSSNPIERTSELPVGHWDEIVDYLICYNGVS